MWDLLARSTWFSIRNAVVWKVMPQSITMPAKILVNKMEPINLGINQVLAL